MHSGPAFRASARKDFHRFLGLAACAALFAAAQGLVGARWPSPLWLWCATGFLLTLALIAWLAKADPANPPTRVERVIEGGWRWIRRIVMFTGTVFFGLLAWATVAMPGGSIGWSLVMACLALMCLWRAVIGSPGTYLDYPASFSPREDLSRCRETKKRFGWR